MPKTTIPRTMRAAALDRFGGPSALSIQRLPVPVIDANEVLIRVYAAGVGSWDAAMRSGEWFPGPRPTFPLVLGGDGSGRIAAVGTRVERLETGDRVSGYSLGNPKGGFYAEYVALPAKNVVPIPRGLDFQRAAAVPATGLTALQGIDDALHIRKGESVIVHGASGGVGSLAVQFAKLRGARVLATASGRDAQALARRLGADMVVDARRQDVAKAARSFAPQGVDAVLALAGGKELTRCLDALRKGGRLAYPNGIEPEPRTRRGIQVKSYDGVSGLRELERLGRAAEESKLKVPIDSSYALANAAKAHERLAGGRVLGRIVLRIR